MKDKQVSGVAQDIMRYLAEHPNAADTIDGIAKWWLARQRVDDAIADVTEALDCLEAQGVISRVEGCKGDVLYHYRHKNHDVPSDS